MGGGVGTCCLGSIGSHSHVSGMPSDLCVAREVVLNLWIVTLLGFQATLSLESHIRYPAYQLFTVSFITSTITVTEDQ